MPDKGHPSKPAPGATELPGLGPKSDRPRLNTAIDLSMQRLTPTEAFVLSRVDGMSSYEQICHLTGLAADQTLEVLRRLKRDGLIVDPRDPVPPTRPSAAGERGRVTPTATPASTLLERLDDGSPVRAEDLAGGPDLPDDLKARIVRLHRRIRALGPHELLGLAANADRAQVKRAYFAASKEIHPDRYYGREIGRFRGLLSDIFARVTDAFQTLDADRK